MGSHKNSFANRIRKAAKKLGEGSRSFTVSEVSIAAVITNRKEDRKVRNTMLDFLKAGEVQRISRGVYVYVGKPRKKVLPLMVQMRNLLKIKGAVTVEDLQELGSKKSSAKEWLQMLARRGVVTPLKNGRYELVPGIEIPSSDEDKATRLRKMRAKKKKALAATLDKIGSSLDETKKELEGL